MQFEGDFFFWERYKTFVERVNGDKKVQTWNNPMSALREDNALKNEWRDGYLSLRKRFSRNARK